jgi:hypothetical protein
MEGYSRAFEFAIQMLESCEGLEIRSALKQAAFDAGIAEGEDMKNFVLWAEDELFAPVA